MRMFYVKGGAWERHYGAMQVSSFLHKMIAKWIVNHDQRSPVWLFAQDHY
jgi:hypothetical protein